MFTKPIPFADAIAALAKRGLLPLSANSAQISGLPPALLDEAFFSSTVSDARILQSARDRVAAILQPEGAAPGASMNTATAREQIRQTLASIGYAPEPGKEGTIQDLTSRQRLDLIIDQNVAMARGRGQWAGTQDPDILDMWPCQELYRAEERQQPRNWTARWRAAGGELYGGRMIARKNAPVWYAISRFGTPWPPFDFGSGMDVADISRDDAEALGVISPDETVAPEQAPALSISTPLTNLDPFLIREVLSLLGPRAQAADGLLTYGGAT
jgi:hypothetical protein